MSNGASLPSCLAHFALACVTGWSLKHLPPQRAEVFPFVFSMMVFLMGYGLLGCIRFSHPQPGPGLRKFYDRVALLARVCPIPFLNAQLFVEHAQPAVYCPTLLVAFCNNASLGYAILMSAVIAFVVGVGFNELSHRYIAENVATAVLLMNLVLLGGFSYDTGNHWGVGLAVSFGTKHFVLPWVAEWFCIPLVDLYTYGLIFYEIFTINVVIDSKYLAGESMLK